jgi:hypothetical protein
MNTRFRRLKLSRLSREALSSAPDSPDLSPTDYDSLLEIVVEKIDENNWAIVDGFHRAAGLANWAEAEDIAYDQIQVKVLDVTGYDEDVIADAAEPSERQDDALQELYDAAK